MVAFDMVLPVRGPVREEEEEGGESIFLGRNRRVIVHSDAQSLLSVELTIISHCSGKL